MSVEIDSWKVTLPCTRAEAEAIDAGEFALDAVLMTTEEVEDDVEHWRLDAYMEDEPSPRSSPQLGPGLRREAYIM
jgi:ribosomal protein L11 methyltransferase